MIISSINTGDGKFSGVLELENDPMAGDSTIQVQIENWSYAGDMTNKNNSYSASAHWDGEWLPLISPADVNASDACTRLEDLLNRGGAIGVLCVATTRVTKATLDLYWF